VGIVGFVLDSDLRALKDLFEIVKYETLDDEDGATVEPVLAETAFTIVDLLTHMKLYIPALYYAEQGIYKVRKVADPSKAASAESLCYGVGLESRRSWQRIGRHRIGPSNEPPPTIEFCYNLHDILGIPDWDNIAMQTSGFATRTSNAVPDTGSSQGASQAANHNANTASRYSQFSLNEDEESPDTDSSGSTGEGADAS
jgi:hypothetical protein